MRAVGTALALMFIVMLAHSSPLPRHALWVGLTMEGASLAEDTCTLASVLGPAANVVVVPAHEPTLRTVHRLMQTHATALLAIGHADQGDRLASVLRVATTLASIRRIVLLHDTPADTGLPVDTSAILVLRDGPEARCALDAIVARDRATTDLPVRRPAASDAWQTRPIASVPSSISNTSLT